MAKLQKTVYKANGPRTANEAIRKSDLTMLLLQLSKRIDV